MATIYASLANVMSEVDHVSKRDRNNHQGFNFRGIDAVVNAVGPALRTHCVIVVPTVISCDYEQITTSGGKQSTSCRIIADYTFYATDGSNVVTRVAAEAFDSGDKATPKAMSVAFRTALLQALALPTDEPDPDSDSYERTTPKQEEAKPAPTAEQYDEWVRVMNDATDVEALHNIGVVANKHDLTQKQRDELKALFIKRRGELNA